MSLFFKKYYPQIIFTTLFFVLIGVMIYQSINIIDRIKSESQNFKQIQLDYALAGDLLSNIPTLKKNTAYIEDHSDWLSVMMTSSDDDKIKLFYFLEQMAKDTGNEDIQLTVKAVQEQKYRKAENGAEVVVPITDNFMNLQITIVGDFDDLVDFVKKIENMQYFSDVLSFNIEKVSGGAYQGESDDEKVLRDDLLKTTMDVIFYLDSN